jgi:mannose-6-phosphate isomerase
MGYKFLPEVAKEEIFDQIRSYLEELAIDITSVDSSRPWGGFFVIDETSTDTFIHNFFPSIDKKDVTKFGSKLTPKILIVEPGEELSWQYHHRRAELWSCISGPVGYKRSMENKKPETLVLKPGEIVQFNPNERHTGIGLENWGIIAEFWQHTAPDRPSDDDDIVRLEDKYGRNI